MLTPRLGILTRALCRVPTARFIPRLGFAQLAPGAARSHHDATEPPREAPYERRETIGDKSWRDLGLAGGVYVVTGGARGLGLCMAEGLVEAGGQVHCLDRLPSPDPAFDVAKSRIVPEHGGSLHYHQANVADAEDLDGVVRSIAAANHRLDGLIAAAAIQQVTPALDYKAEDIERMMATNYTGVFLTARSCARQMMRYKVQGSICIIGSMSGVIANKGFSAAVYNSSKAAVLQLTRNLAMEWGRINPDGSGGIRVNSISPGHILTPMVEENFRKGEADRNAWEQNNMLGRISRPEEYKAPGLFLLSKASSYMTGANLVIDGGCTAW